MNRIVHPIAATAILFGFYSAADAQNEIGVRTLPPVVVKTVPQSGDIKVDPNTNEVRVTFSKRMQNGSWSWSTVSAQTNPETTGKPRYLADGKTCVLPVKLQPNHTYGFWLNSENFGNFKDRQGRSAVPYLLVFETRRAAAGGKALKQ